MTRGCSGYVVHVLGSGLVGGGGGGWLALDFFLILRCASGARPRRSLSPIPTFPVVVGVLPISSGGDVCCLLTRLPA